MRRVPDLLVSSSDFFPLIFRLSLLSGPHTPRQSGDIRVYEKDLFLHEDKTGREHFSFRIRPTNDTGKDKVVPVSPVMAERYLLRRGFTRDEFPTSEPVFRLCNRGYGIAEEFQSLSFIDFPDRRFCRLCFFRHPADSRRSCSRSPCSTHPPGPLPGQPSRTWSGSANPSPAGHAGYTCR